MSILVGSRPSSMSGFIVEATTKIHSVDFGITIGMLNKDPFISSRTLSEKIEGL